MPLRSTVSVATSAIRAASVSSTSSAVVNATAVIITTTKKRATRQDGRSGTTAILQKTETPGRPPREALSPSDYAMQIDNLLPPSCPIRRILLERDKRGGKPLARRPSVPYFVESPIGEGGGI